MNSRTKAHLLKPLTTPCQSYRNSALSLKQNLYGKTLEISFLAFIRKEERMDSIQELQDAIEKDEAYAIYEKYCLSTDR